MMRIFTSVVIALFMVPTLISPALAAEMTQEERINELDREIEVAKGEQKTGRIIGFSGAGLVLTSIFFVPETEHKADCSSGYCEVRLEERGDPVIWGSLLVGGSILGVWGGLKARKASRTIERLEAEKRSISFNPMIKPEQDGNYKFSLNMTIIW